LRHHPDARVRMAPAADLDAPVQPILLAVELQESIVDGATQDFLQRTAPLLPVARQNLPIHEITTS
jgi:hypothetical protein